MTIGNAVSLLEIGYSVLDIGYCLSCPSPVRRTREGGSPPFYLSDK